MLKTRIITALILVAAFVPALFMLSNVYWAYAMLVVALLALNEWAGLIQLSTTERIIYLAIAAIAGLAIVQMMQQQGFHTFFYHSLNVFLIVTVFWALLAPCWLAKKWAVNKHILALLGLLLMGSVWLALICAKSSDPWLLLALLATIWIADSAAYFAGKNFGKHKLAPSISPGKTWEGVLGAMIAVTLFGMVLYLGFDVKTLAIFPALWAIAGLGVIGDLFESMLKRQANIKDSGNLLPGHGGILDRIDGIIPSLPIAILMIYVYNLWWQ
jgi:phosphatidate cytidylyltransferase